MLSRNCSFFFFFLNDSCSKRKRRVWKQNTITKLFFFFFSNSVFFLSFFSFSYFVWIFTTTKCVCKLNTKEVDIFLAKKVLSIFLKCDVGFTWSLQVGPSESSRVVALCVEMLQTRIAELSKHLFPLVCTTKSEAAAVKLCSPPMHLCLLYRWNSEVRANQCEAVFTVLRSNGLCSCSLLGHLF